MGINTDSVRKLIQRCKIMPVGSAKVSARGGPAHLFDPDEVRRHHASRQAKRTHPVLTPVPTPVSNHPAPLDPDAVVDIYQLTGLALRDEESRQKIRDQRRKNDLAEGILGYQEDFRKCIVAIRTVVNSRLDARAGRYGSRFAGMDDPAEIEHIMQKDSDELMDELSEVIRKFNEAPVVPRETRGRPKGRKTGGGAA